jgi:hypothetical protein
MSVTVPRHTDLRRTAGEIAGVAAVVGAASLIAFVARRSRRRAIRHHERRESTVDISGDVGPVDLAVIRFTGNRFTGEVAPALLGLVRNGTVRIFDALLVTKDADGRVGSLEIGDLGPDLRPAFVAVDGQVGAGLLEPEDVAEVGADLEPGTSALLLVFENTWAARFAGACRRAGGELVDIARIPAQAVAETLERYTHAGRPIGA